MPFIEKQNNKSNNNFDKKNFKYDNNNNIQN